jgi:hypothetical protein
VRVADAASVAADQLLGKVTEVPLVLFGFHATASNKVDPAVVAAAHVALSDVVAEPVFAPIVFVASRAIATG